jgi:hypothetical protein
MKYATRANLTKQTVDDEILLLDIENNHIHQLNPTASFIWELCEQGRTTDEIAQLMVARFDIDDETALRDITNIVSQWRDLGLIDVVTE